MKQLKIMFIILLIFNLIASAGELSRTFEFRYVDNHPEANGETDFKGESAIFATDQRISFLHHYAEYLKYFFVDPNIDKLVVEDYEVKNALNSIKEQPLPNVRQRILLKNWKWIGYKKEEINEKIQDIQTWSSLEGLNVSNGVLIFEKDGVKVEKLLPSQSWRFFIQWKVKLTTTNKRVTFSLMNSSRDPAVTVGLTHDNQFFYYSAKEEFIIKKTYDINRWYHFKIEVDLSRSHYNLYIDNELAIYDVKFHGIDPIYQINIFECIGIKGEKLDEIWGVGYKPTAEIDTQYSIRTFIDQDFDVKPKINGWNQLDYDDHNWCESNLPIVHGGERYAGEDLYLRKSFFVSSFEQAVLNVETFDPGGEIWINGKCILQVRNRHPVQIDVGNYLNKNDSNLIAIKINHFFVKSPKAHTPADINIGWFAGRMYIDLMNNINIHDMFIYTKKITNSALLPARIEINNKTHNKFQGSICIEFYPWYPVEEANPVFKEHLPVEIKTCHTVIEKTILIENPRLWTYKTPNLYKIKLKLINSLGEIIDDYVLTTGIRIISQEGGVFRINNKPEMLNGAQIFGYRPPLEKIALHQRCASVEDLVNEILMIKKMNGNAMRVHVHAWKSPARNINDPRLAEIGDQLGIMFIWATTAWIRSGDWRGIDFNGYPKYMKQVYNHPSIVMWEASNHPDEFKSRIFTESNLFYEQIYNTIYPIDPSRLISPTSHIMHTHFGNDLGTIDFEGNSIIPSFAWTAEKITRGNQDAITGYGNDWIILRKWPTDFQKTFLDSRERAYFNFEHEESIGQPNWELAKGKPWYHIHSYEWDYDEGSIGRRLTFEEWQESQAWQAFSAYESMKKQRISDYDGMIWCCLHGGPNNVTYHKPIIDYYGHAKLAFYSHQMIFQRVLAGSRNVDVVYGPTDKIHPIIMNIGDEKTVDFRILVRNTNKEVVDKTIYRNVRLQSGRTVTSLPDFKPAFPVNGYYAIEYYLDSTK